MYASCQEEMTPGHEHEVFPDSSDSTAQNASLDKQSIHLIPIDDAPKLLVFRLNFLYS